MDLGLRDKVAVITGASRGVGAATARILADEGVDVVVCYGGDRDGAEATAAAVRAAGRRAWIHGIELRDAAAVDAAFAAIGREVGGLDILILCAGQNIVTQLPELTPAEWDLIVATNLHGPFYALHAAIPLLRDGASIVAVASVAGQTGAPHHAHYAAAKAGLINLAKSAARSLAPRVRVNSIAPGITMTQMGIETAAGLSADYAQTKLLAGRFAEPEEIARAIAFLASPLVGFITGATLDINGGRELR